MRELEYKAPGSVKEAIDILRRHGAGACIVAGSTNVVPDMRAGKIAPSLLVNIENINELRGIEVAGKTVTLGSLTRIAELLESDVVRTHAGVLYRAARDFADPLVRNRATVGGNLANASPAADTAVPLLALDACVVIVGQGGEREIPLARFFVGPNSTVLALDELIRAVRFESDSAYRKAYLKFGLRGAMAISVVSVAIVLDIDGDRATSARVAFGAVAPTPIRAYEVERFLIGKRLTDEILEEARVIVSREVRPISDLRASESYRRYVSGALFVRALKMALTDERKGAFPWENIL